MNLWRTGEKMPTGTNGIATRNYAPRFSRRHVCVRRLLLVQEAEVERDLNLP